MELNRAKWAGEYVKIKGEFYNLIAADPQYTNECNRSTIAKFDLFGFHELGFCHSILDFSIHPFYYVVGGGKG